MKMCPVRYLLKMANGGGGSSADSESFEEDVESESDAAPKAAPKAAPVARLPLPRPPSHAPPLRGAVAVKSAARRPEVRGASARPPAEAASSESVSPAPARREARPKTLVHESPPRPAAAAAAPARPAAARTSEGRRVEKRRVERAHAERRPRVTRGRGKHKSQHCSICWQEVGAYASALDQHQRWNLDCLQWQHFEAGDCTWEEAREKAVRTKTRRDARAIEQQARVTDRVSAGGWDVDRVDLRDHSGHSAAKESKGDKHVTIHVKEKKKKRRSHRSRRHASSPTPEVEHRRRRHEKPPTSSDEDAPRSGKRPHKRQLVITLPDHVRW